MKHCTTSPRVHRKQRRLLQRSFLRCCLRRHPTTAVSSACCRAADHRYPTLRTHHTDAAWHSPLAADITAHPLQKLRWWCSTVLAADVWSTSVMCALLYTPLLFIHDYDQQNRVTSSSHACGRFSLAAAVSAYADQQFGTHSRRICEAQTLGNSLSVGLRTGYSSVHCTCGRRRVW